MRLRRRTSSCRYRSLLSFAIRILFIGLDFFLEFIQELCYPLLVGRVRQLDGGTLCFQRCFPICQLVLQVRYCIEQKRLHFSGVIHRFLRDI